MINLRSSLCVFLCLAAVFCGGCALTRMMGKIIPNGDSKAEADTSPPANIVMTPKAAEAPEMRYREVTRYKEVTKQIETTCEGHRWVPGEIDVAEYSRIAVYPLEVRGFNSDLALYWSEVIENWLVGTNRFSVVTRSELESVFGSHRLGRGEPMDPEIMAVLRRVYGIQAIVHGTVYGARGGSNWNLRMLNSESGTVIWDTDGSGDLSTAVHETLSPFFGYQQAYTYPCTTTVTEQVPYVVREKHVACRKTK